MTGGVLGARCGVRKTTEPRFIKTTAGQVAARLARLGIAPDQHVTVAVEPDDWLTEVRKITCPRVLGEAWSDADIDRHHRQGTGIRAETEDGFRFAQPIPRLLPDADKHVVKTLLDAFLTKKQLQTLLR